MLEVICLTALAVFVLGGALFVLTIEAAWLQGGEFYIKGNKGRRKSWVERLLDGFEVLRRM